MRKSRFGTTGQGSGTTTDTTDADFEEFWEQLDPEKKYDVEARTFVHHLFMAIRQSNFTSFKVAELRPSPSRRTYEPPSREHY